MKSAIDHTILIDCPAHPNQHWAALWQHPHPDAGIWECPKGDAGEHEHEELEVEKVEPWPTGPEDNPREYEIYVCSLCSVEVDGDPEADRAEALADMQSDNWRGE